VREDEPIIVPAPVEAPAPAESVSIVETIQTTTENVEKVQTAVSRVSRGSWAVTLSTMVGGWVAGLWGFVSENPEFTIAAALLILGAIWYLTKSKQRSMIKNGYTLGN
jgi:cellulase/cellobiase CelA1